MDKKKKLTSSMYRISNRQKMKRMRAAKKVSAHHVPNIPVPPPLQIFETAESGTDNIICSEEIIKLPGSDFETVPEEEAPSASTANIMPVQHILEDRRIIDIKHFFEEILNGKLHEPFHCSIINMELIGEKRHGLCSEFLLKCKMCQITRTISSENVDEKSSLNINSAAVLSSLSTGIGFSNLEETHAALSIPAMSNRRYLNHHNLLSSKIRDSAWSVMEEAGMEEARLARELGEIDENGNPLVTVVADGAWCKRSYGTNYGANSGVGCIIGARTHKLLFLGIRNKYCAICARAENKKNEPNVHDCFKNWKGTSTGMESDIIVDGFHRSLELHGVIYYQLVGDGDSSVMKKLLQTKPYGNRMVQKIECTNHLLRNFCNKLRELAVKKRSNSLNLLVSPTLRQHLKSSVMRLRFAVVKAAKFRKADNAEDFEKNNKLKEDLLNCPNHVFGDHAKCASYFCKGAKEGEKNLIPDMQSCGLLQDIMSIVYRLVHNANSLIFNITNNHAEQYNSILCKFIGGKRINFSQKGSYETRCEAAAISYNTKGEFLRKIHHKVTTRSPSKVTKKYLEKMARRNQMRAKRRFLPDNRRSRRTRTASADEDYGPLANILPDNTIPEDTDMNPVDFEESKNVFLKKIKKTDKEIEGIELASRGQSSNTRWKEERSLRLTASNFGKICKMLPKTSCANTIKNLLYSDFFGTAATNYGLENEPVAKMALESKLNISIKDCGFFIGKGEYYYLGASPDGIVNDNKIVEIKCPYSARDLTVQEAIEKKIIKFAIIDENGELKLKNRDNYMFQVQGQLELSNSEICYFVVWTRKGFMVQEIQRDKQFWNNMEKKLKIFYFNCMLPELVDPRHTRKPPCNIIRNPPRN